jgi:hypothetical protein
MRIISTVEELQTVLFATPECCLVQEQRDGNRGWRGPKTMAKILGDFEFGRVNYFSETGQDYVRVVRFGEDTIIDCVRPGKLVIPSAKAIAQILGTEVLVPYDMPKLPATLKLPPNVTEREIVLCNEPQMLATLRSNRVYKFWKTTPF